MVSSHVLTSLERTCVIWTKTRLQAEEGRKGPESNVEQITAAKEAIAKAKTAEREIS